MADESSSERSAWDGERAGAARRWGSRLALVPIEFLVFKPITIFVWWFSRGGNDVRFHGRRELRRRIQRALADGRPVLVASNHVSWFDDPVIPMALHRSGERACLELLAVVAFVVALASVPLPGALVFAGGVLAASASALFGTRKHWWTLGDLANLSDASVLEGKLALTRRKPPGPWLRRVLALADRVIPWFMRSETTKTVFVDRRPGEDAKRARARAVEVAVELAAALDPVWVFFEGGRTKIPGEISPARRGVGALALGLRERGLSPLVVVICHRGMERLIPPGGSRFLSFGHRVDVGWSVLDEERVATWSEGDQALADAVREEAIRIQHRLPAPAADA